jgi:DNA replication and repair protein RecF
MKLTSLKLHSFRNYNNLEIDLDTSKNFFALVGKNGQGKTNFIEAIAMLALTKSFRQSDSAEILSWDNEFFRIEGSFINADQENNDLELFYQSKPRQKRAQKINGVTYKNTDFIGNLLVTVFSVEDIFMMSASPMLRRRYLDMVLSQVEPSYVQDLLNYQKSVKQRNKLLKSIQAGRSQREELFFWDEECIKLGMSIHERRQRLFDYYNLHIQVFYEEISGAKEYDIQMAYKSNLLNKSYEEALQEMQRRYDRDIATEATSLGPHRDDWMFLCNQKEFMNFSSRGELRSMILSLKMAERDFFFQKKGSYPILLLDDVFSELDEERRRYLLNNLKDQQTFITTTEKECFEEIGDKLVMWEAEDGKLEECKTKSEKLKSTT